MFSIVCWAGSVKGWSEESSVTEDPAVAHDRKRWRHRGRQAFPWKDVPKIIQISAVSHDGVAATAIFKDWERRTLQASPSSRVSAWVFWRSWKRKRMLYHAARNIDGQPGLLNQKKWNTPMQSWYYMSLNQRKLKKCLLKILLRVRNCCNFFETLLARSSQFLHWA